MESLKRFNGLNGATVSREELLSIIYLAEKEEQSYIAQKLKAILLKNSDSSFTFDIETPALESTPKSMLNGLQALDLSEDVYGLGKAVSSAEIYDMITNLVMNTIKKVGHLPWQKEWQGSGGKQAKNYVTKKGYSGINFMLLNFDVKFDENDEPYLVPVTFINPYYLTFNQIKDANATLKKGSKARNVIYYTPLFVYDDGNLQIKTSDKGKYSTFITKNGITETDMSFHASQIPVVKYYNVYKADDCTGLKFQAEKERSVTPIESAQGIIDNYPNPPKYTFIGSDAKYSPMLDEVNMPSIKAFTKESFYYSTYFHEIIHSTGHSKRLDRGNDTRLRDGSLEDKKAYAFEELVAELGAVFLCSESGILFHTIENSAKYLNGWNKRLLSYLQEDNKMFFKASAQAQKASNWILDLDKNEVPAYLNKKIEARPKEKTAAKKTVTKSFKKEKSDKPAIEQPAKALVKAKTRPNYSIKRKYVPKPKVGKNGQTALFGAKNGLNGPFDDAEVKTEETVLEKEISDPVKTEPTVLANVEKPKNKLMSMEFDSLPINDEWSELMQHPASNMKIAIWGPPKNGKTAASLQMANYLTNFGNVLYNFADQGFNKSTQDLWKESGLSENTKAEPSDISKIDDLEKEIATGKYKFVFIDMISDYIRTEKIKPEEFKERFIKKYPNVSFILIFEVTKGGNFKGDQGWTHLVDAIMTVEDFLIENRGRYGMGQRIIWEDGFKKFNPKKYKELQEAKVLPIETEPTEAPILSFTAIEL